MAMVYEQSVFSDMVVIRIVFMASPFSVTMVNKNPQPVTKTTTVVLQGRIHDFF